MPSQEPLPEPSLDKLAIPMAMVQAIKDAELEDDIKDAEMLKNLRDPTPQSDPIDDTTEFSIDMFMSMIGGSQRMYDEARNALSRRKPPVQIHSYHTVQKIIEKITGVTQIRTDMCPNSCLAYTGPFSHLTECPTCQTPRYERVKNNEKKPLKQFYTIPLGSQLQALWRTPEGADRMRYKSRITAEFLRLYNASDGDSSSYMPKFEDIFHGSEYITAVLNDKIKDDDTLVMFSWDGAQLYRDKQSDCFFAIWVVLNLSPDIRYKKKYILPACFIPGPKKPDNPESFLLPGFRHLSALQKHGLRVWEGRQHRFMITRPFFAFGTADTVALPMLSGLVGHKGGLGCRIYCGMPGRHRPRQPTYYPAALKPFDFAVVGSDHGDVDLITLALNGPDQIKYDRNLRILMQSRSNARYNEIRLATGIVRPSICLGFQKNVMFAVPKCFPIDLMHLISLNVPQHILSIWRNTTEVTFPYGNQKPDFFVLDDDIVWQTHGEQVAAMRCYLPTSIDRPPRNPAKKINSGYKASEYLMYFWSLGPALFRLVLPEHLWTHYCKLVSAIRLIHQRRITLQQLATAHKMLIQWVIEFEQKYYGRHVDRLHLVRPCIHMLIHLGQETVRCGPLNLLAQWSLETTIGNLGQEVHQHSNPFSNLAERGLLRGQINALKAIFPQFDHHKTTLPRGSLNLKDGYWLLRASVRHAVLKSIIGGMYPLLDICAFLLN
ncbi:hypothetical protein M378DRAFT_92912 [Amanita muscaria Koide BX008]|uniref:Uncharacterized protein n=1 Tax=Amanita muscaria (strain Koide BX008) TaxID=946122 RepID=A0A0C2WDW4_AMAMK|nr:hypothetical protein M378DRAFT_92912 [Amanita muscaria Koide BX008]